MVSSDPIGVYLRELQRELRVRGRARRRITNEIRAHLLDAADAERSKGAEEGSAARHAVISFGPAAETAHQFNNLPGRRGAVLRRVLVPWIAAAALTSTATATVWAFQAGPAPSQQVRAHPARRQGCAQPVARQGLISPRSPSAEVCPTAHADSKPAP
jgi:hypothetical protein